MDNDVTQKPTDRENSYPSENKNEFPFCDSVAIVPLEAGKMLMEAGANAKTVEGITQLIAHGLGAQQVELRTGYASLTIAVGIDEARIIRMRSLGELGVNQRLIQALWNLGKSVSGGELTVEQTRVELNRLRKETPRHPNWVTALAAGLACAAFGRLLGVDWYAVGPIFLAATTGQYVRRVLLRAQVNAFLCAAIISFLSCVPAGLGARWAGSATITIAMIASILMLVPGVPAVNALSDILEGHPTLGTARAVTVVMTLIFVAAGLWLGNAAINEWHPR